MNYGWVNEVLAVLSDVERDEESVYSESSSECEEETEAESSEIDLYNNWGCYCGRNDG